MELFQELTFTACLAVILSLVVVKVVSFAVCNSTTDGETAVCSLNEGKVPNLNNTKIKKRVTFVDDVVVNKKIHRYESENDSENLVLSDDLIKSMGEVIVGQNKEIVDQFGDSELKTCDEQDKGCKNIDILIEKNHGGDQIRGVFGENEKSLVANMMNSVIVDEINEVALGSDDLMVDRTEGNRVADREEGLIGDNVEGNVIYEDDDWVEIERIELLDKD